MLLAAALLTTNITFGLIEIETVPTLFLLFGAATVLARGALVHARMLAVAGAMLLYALVGVFAGDALDSIRLVSAALVFVTALQLTDLRMLAAACRASIVVLLALRLLSLAFPEPFTVFYESLGLRGIEYYGGTASVLFAEPSYLATAVFAMWAIGRMGLALPRRTRIGWLDYASAALLLLSFSVWGAIDLAVGALIVLRKRPLLLGGIAAAIATALVIVFASEEIPGRLGVFVEAISIAVASGSFIDFVMLDPSAGHRLVQAYLAVSSALAAPFGELSFELTPVLVTDASHWSRSIFGGPVVALQLLGQLYANTVPLQLLVFGGFPLFAIFMVPVVLAIARLWRLRRVNDTALLVLASVVFGCIGQSLLNSPFLYLCIAVGLFWKENRSDEAIGRHHQLQQARGASTDAGQLEGADGS